jgi:hypothetical protein
MVGFFATLSRHIKTIQCTSGEIEQEFQRQLCATLVMLNCPCNGKKPYQMLDAMNSYLGVHRPFCLLHTSLTIVGA